jgi:TetR/AcrR family transcriptional regulator, transcriptional repressor for nem operon
MGRVSDAREKLMDAVMELIHTGSYGSTTIDHICEKAGVKKGSFYYFFDSKSDLAIAAVEARFQEDRKLSDVIFSPAIPPLERIHRMCQYLLEQQGDLQKKHGKVLGCPLYSIGSEVSTEEPELCAKIQEIMVHHREYLESTIRDAHAQGLIHAPDPAAKAEMVFAYYEGLLTHARIQNDLSVLSEMEEGTMSLLGITETASA